MDAGCLGKNWDTDPRLRHFCDYVGLASWNPLCVFAKWKYYDFAYIISLNLILTTPEGRS